MAAVKFEMVPGIGSRIQSKIYGSSGKVVLTSQGFQHKEACLEWIRAVKEHAANDKLLHMNGEPGRLGFVLKAPNHKMVLKAGPYATPEARDEALAAVRGASQAAVVDKA